MYKNYYSFECIIISHCYNNLAHNILLDKILHSSVYKSLLSSQNITQ